MPKVKFSETSKYMRADYINATFTGDLMQSFVFRHGPHEFLSIQPPWCIPINVVIFYWDLDHPCLWGRWCLPNECQGVMDGERVTDAPSFHGWFSYSDTLTTHATYSADMVTSSMQLMSCQSLRRIWTGGTCLTRKMRVYWSHYTESWRNIAVCN